MREVQISDWQAFYNSLAIEPMYGETAPRPNIDQLDRFEAESGFRLSKSYRDFILVFGPGTLFSDWNIAAPGYGTPTDSWNLLGCHAGYQPDIDYMTQLYSEELKQRVRRSFYFCWKYKDRFGWDLTEVSDPETNEYVIHRITEDRKMLRYAASFQEFVEVAALDILTMPGWDEEELGPRMLFEPASVP